MYNKGDTVGKALLDNTIRIIATNKGKSIKVKYTHQEMQDMIGGIVGNYDKKIYLLYQSYAELINKMTIQNESTLVQLYSSCEQLMNIINNVKDRSQYILYSEKKAIYVTPTDYQMMMQHYFNNLSRGQKIYKAISYFIGLGSNAPNKVYEELKRLDKEECTITKLGNIKTYEELPTGEKSTDYSPHQWIKLLEQRFYDKYKCKDDAGRTIKTPRKLLAYKREKMMYTAMQLLYEGENYIAELHKSETGTTLTHKEIKEILKHINTVIAINNPLTIVGKPKYIEGTLSNLYCSIKEDVIIQKNKATMLDALKYVLISENPSLYNYFDTIVKLANEFIDIHDASIYVLPSKEELAPLLSLVITDKEELKKKEYIARQYGFAILMNDAKDNEEKEYLPDLLNQIKLMNNIRDNVNVLLKDYLYDALIYLYSINPMYDIMEDVTHVKSFKYININIENLEKQIEQYNKAVYIAHLFIRGCTPEETEKIRNIFKSIFPTIQPQKFIPDKEKLAAFKELVYANDKNNRMPALLSLLGIYNDMIVLGE